MHVYTLTLQDRYSAPMKKATGVSVDAGKKFQQLRQQSQAVKRSFDDFGGSIGSLRQKIELLKREKEIIDPKNISTIQQYNREIGQLTKQVEKLDNATGKSSLRTWAEGLSAQIPAFLKNPYTMAAAALGFGGKQALSFDEGMAKVNITARLEDEEFEQLKKRVREIASENKADANFAPEALNQIISQTGDLELSLDILNSTLKGAKSQFADPSVVAGALAQTLSLVGKENTTAPQVLDTFIAAKRAGAGEFTDFAQYMPSLVAAGDAVGLKYQEVAGLFSYMTGKGLRPERASVMLTNSFNILGRSEVAKQMKKAGIKVHDDKGNIRSSLDIMGEMQGVMGNMTDQQKSLFLEGLGITDKQSKQAFMVLTSDLAKLDRTLEEVRDSAGETDRALAFSANTNQRIGETWNQFKNHLLEVGMYALPVVDGALRVVNFGMGLAVGLVDKLSGFFGGWFGLLERGNPLVWGLTAAVGAAVTIYGIHTLMLKAHAIQLAVVNFWNKMVMASTGLLTKAMHLLKVAFLTTPWGWVALGVGAIAASFAALSNKAGEATKSFAGYHAELRRGNRESEEYFRTAMDAKEGSEERAKAIQKINDKYKDYLPYLLTEKMSNDELAGALRLVNGELERKIKNKFLDKELERIGKSIQEAEDELFKMVLSKVPDHLHQPVIADLQATMAKIQAGEMSQLEAQRHFKENYNVGGLFSEWNPMYWGTFGKDGNLYNSFGQRLGDWMNAINRGERDKQNALLRFGGQIPGINDANEPGDTNVTNIVTVNAPAQPGVTPLAQPPGMNESQITALIQSLNSTKGSGSKSSSVVDLNKLPAANLSGSGSYKAIVSKLMPKMLPTLTAASMALPVSLDMSEMPETLAPGMEQRENVPARLSLSKFCDKIEIHIDKADDRGMEEIRREVERTLNETLRKYYDDYQV